METQPAACKDDASVDGTLPRVTFGIIVLNGEPYTRYCLRALYPFAHEIIVVEGACLAAAAIATADGHSIDGTLEALRRFKEEEDVENKVHIVTRDGFWEEKDESSQAYAERATGDYLWQVDIDEFYRPEDMRAVLDLLRADPGITAVSFKQITFWGGFDYTTDGWYLRRGADVYHRLFKWDTGFRYVTHRPPTLHNAQGRDLRSLKWHSGEQMAKRGIYLYHYSLVFPKQVREKCEYYSRAAWANRSGACLWAERNFFELRQPFRVHNVYAHPSWLERFKGRHPPQIEALRNDIRNGCLKVEMRQTGDVEALLTSHTYRLGRVCLKILDFVDQGVRALVRAPWFIVGAVRSLVRAGLRFLKVGLKAAFGLAGLEVRKKRPGGLLSVDRDSLRGVLLHARSVGCAPCTVIDVGAAYGSFTQECHAVFPDARYILMEPLVEYKPALARIVRSVEQAEYIEAAAAAHDDERTIHVHPDLVGSSLYREVEEGSDVNGTPRIIRAVTVDGVMQRNAAKGPFFFKVDVQGAELDVLRGAEQTLRETEWVLLEVSLFRFFQGGPDICDVIAYMRSRGFAPYDVHELQYRPLDNALSQVDIVFVKENGLFRRRHHFATPEQREEENRKIHARLRDRIRRLR